ncbi:MAG: membrane protein insertase YidC, partial [Kiritimatiellae bacterium]|nr:membrane protein insertase YidC [Kiritimatiellia bacterium]
YLGPKVYDTLLATGYHREDVLQLGFWRVIGIWILKLMVWFRNHVWPYNYGLSIILLTLLIRVIFWPLNHKSLASTRRMQEIQPLVAEIREKYKKDPQRQQQEMMRIYKENKINPLGGCLPMLIQIPVFFALFVVLRGAIELRFSSFLWIADLSTPENLFADVLPIPLNILPLFMGVTMWLQQKMTPTSDPQQQKMMLMMPILFTVLFYSFPSGLSLYWSTNQILMILQLALMRRKQPAPATATAR